jgi:hypothetical protein
MLRSYDPQIGRFLQWDPYDQFASGYVGMGNDPGNMVDEDGGWSGPVKPMTFGQIFVDNATWANSAPSLMDVVVTPTVVELAASAARTAAKSSFVAGAIDATKNMVIGLARMSNIFTMVSHQVNSAATTAEALRAGDYKKALQNEPTGFYNLGVNAVEAFKGNGYAQGTLAVNVVAALAIKKVAPRPVAAGSSSKVARVPAGNAGNAGSGAGKTGLTNPQLVQKSATLAERAIGGSGGVAGTAKHQYANKLLNRYQKIYGDRGLLPNHSFNNGVGNRGFLDVLDNTNGIIYDFKFGNAVMSPAQFNKYTRNFGLPIQIIRP